MTRALPTLFIPHGGGPCFFMEWTMGPPDTWHKMGDWLRQVGSSLGTIPDAVVVISGHWEEPAFSATSAAHPPLIYDYSGFPPETYQITYPAPGSPALADQVVQLLAQAGIAGRTDPRRGFDHGVFIPFKLIYPNADVPIVLLSLQKGLDPTLHISAGRALEPLRRENVLIVGSGMSYHNLGKLFQGGPIGSSDQFDSWLTETICAPDANARNQRLIQWDRAPAARDAHPREEHLIPLIVAAGAAGKDIGKRVFTDRVMGAVVSAYRFGE